MLTHQLFEQHVSLKSINRDPSDINRVLAAAVVSKAFCHLLLTNPTKALAQGFCGERFSLSVE